MNNAGMGKSELQTVEEFRHFLLRNDSSFCDYVNSPLMLSVFDTHLCVKAWFQSWPRFSAMAKQKQLLLDDQTSHPRHPRVIFHCKKNCVQQQLRILPSQTCGDVLRLLDVERCSIFLYNCVKDSLFCKVITGRLREPITFKRES